MEIVNTGSGNCNSGNCNSGNWNKTDNSSGIFNSVKQPLFIFNKPSEMNFQQWRNSDACRLLNRINFAPTEWIWSDDMTEEEKEVNKDWETCGGYLKKLDTSDCCIEWWSELSNQEKCIIQNIPNFDADVFFEITGIRA